MRTLYLQKNKKGWFGRYRSSFLFILFILVLFYAFQVFFPGVLGGVIRNVGVPFWKSGSFLNETFARYSELVQSKYYLITENERLKQELNQSQMTVLGYTALKEQYEWFVPKSDESAKGITARVLVRPPQTVYDTFILDVGEKDGVRQGDFVYYSDTIIVGEITKTSENSSEAQLFSTGNKEVRVVLGGKTEFSAYGKGGGMYELRIPKEVPVTVGDSVIRPGNDLSVYGTVALIEIGESNSFKKVYFRLPFNLHELARVRVIPQTSHE